MTASLPPQKDEVEDSAAAVKSRLGTKEHWDSVYVREGKTFAELGEEGDIWFGESSAEDMVDWVVDNLPTSCSIMDVGCGNGDLSFRLYNAGYENVVGADYSLPSIELARAILKRRAIPLDPTSAFVVRDVLGEELDQSTMEKFGLLTDKGTYDAISLSLELIGGRTLAEIYPKKIAALLEPGGTFLITSCNWTRPELEKAFATPATGLSYHSHVPRPSFTFGGATGHTVTTIAFVKATP